MSTIIMSQCWPIQGMSAPQKAVLISLADMANDDGVCWPSVAHIATRTCLSERSVQNAIKWLVEAGALTITERVGRSTVYTVTPAGYAPPQGVRGAGNVETPAPRAPTPAGGAPTPAPRAPITINNQQGTVKEPSKRRAKIALPDWLPLESWDMWCRFRRSKSGSGWNDDAKRLFLSKLTKLYEEGNDPTAVIEQSIERGWTTVYPLKTQPLGGRKTPAPENFKEKAYVGTDEADIDWLR